MHCSPSILPVLYPSFVCFVVHRDGPSEIVWKCAMHRLARLFSHSHMHHVGVETVYEPQSKGDKHVTIECWCVCVCVCALHYVRERSKEHRWIRMNWQNQKDTYRNTIHVWLLNASNTTSLHGKHTRLNKVRKCARKIGWSWRGEQKRERKRKSGREIQSND